MTHKRLDSLLNSSNDRDLGDIVRRARDMGELVGRLQASLPDEEAASVVAANLRDDGTLVVLVRASVWASRLRFAEAALLAAARSSGRQAERLEVRVARGDS